ncbi:hypothetical protein HW555_001241 [Spodoptera exigua]|uniref:Uncharacterized protein n=1 Tax=Spodoptera exigua TaxID=7107 RepID=A0A835GQF6_SPOEX|nr:hypothetical protein HW555_001241 [Spodoptera exigua]
MMDGLLRIVINKTPFLHRDFYCGHLERDRRLNLSMTADILINGNVETRESSARLKKSEGDVFLPLFPGTTEMDQLKRTFMDLGTPSDMIWPGYSTLPLVRDITFDEYPPGGLRKMIDPELLSKKKCEVKMKLFETILILRYAHHVIKTITIGYIPRLLNFPITFIGLLKILNLSIELMEGHSELTEQPTSKRGKWLL